MLFGLKNDFAFFKKTLLFSNDASAMKNIVVVVNIFSGVSKIVFICIGNGYAL